MVANTDGKTWGFGSTVTAVVRGHEIDVEVVGTGPDNRDLEDDQYLVAVGGMDLQRYDDLHQEELIRETDVRGVIDA
jgi:hypothetical protein